MVLDFMLFLKLKEFKKRSYKQQIYYFHNKPNIHIMAKPKNANLHGAKTAKNDEFYTQLSDIENELYHYKDFFRDKTVYCNCDNPEESNFWKYFKLNFDFFGLKRVISTHYQKNLKINDNETVINSNPYKLEIHNDGGIKKTYLNGDGDFRSDECIQILKESDFVITNPPFSLFREFIDVMDEHNKKFIIIGSQNAITYKNTINLIKNNKLWLGFGFKGLVGYFINKHYEDYAKSKNHIENMIRVSGVVWFTNLPHKKRNEKLTLFRNYYGCESDYPKYDGFDAINIDKTAMIPFDYEGVMGVPITFLDKFNPEQFEILGAESFCDIEVRDGVFQKPNHKLENSNRLVYKRIWIKNKNPQKVMGIDNE